MRHLLYCVCICFFCQALEIQNLYKISVETCVQCLDCSSVQTLNTYLLSLPLHVKEDHDSLVNFVFSLDLDEYFNILENIVIGCFGDS